MGRDTGTGRRTGVWGRDTGGGAARDEAREWDRLGERAAAGFMACLSAAAGGKGTQARHEYRDRTSVCFPGGQGCRGMRGGRCVVVAAVGGL